jgi:hypothetical protein
MIISIPDDQYDHRVKRRAIIIGGAASLICAPAIVRAINLMPVRRLPFRLGLSPQGSLNVYGFGAWDSCETCRRGTRGGLKLGYVAGFAELAGRPQSASLGH